MAEATLKVGDTAPDFALPSDVGETVKLSDFRGKREETQLAGQYPALSSSRRCDTTARLPCGRVLRSFRVARQSPSSPHLSNCLPCFVSSKPHLESASPGQPIPPRFRAAFR